MSFIIALTLAIGAIYFILNYKKLLRVIPNYRHDYIVEFDHSLSIPTEKLKAIPNISQIKNYDAWTYSFHIDKKLNTIPSLLHKSLGIDENKMKINYLHSWNKTNVNVS